MVQRLGLGLLIAAVVGCGSDAPTFAGTWDGSFTTIQNDCPFSTAAPQEINPLFPQVVTIDSSDVFTVVAIDGSVATGGQGDGETISFLANAATFGDYGSTAPYSCESSSAAVGYLGIGDDKAEVTLTYTFTNCTEAGSTNAAISCGVIYFADAERIG